MAVIIVAENMKKIPISCSACKLEQSDGEDRYCGITQSYTDFCDSKRRMDCPIIAEIVT